MQQPGRRAPCVQGIGQAARGAASAVAFPFRWVAQRSARRAQQDVELGAPGAPRNQRQTQQEWAAAMAARASSAGPQAAEQAAGRAAGEPGAGRPAGRSRSRSRRERRSSGGSSSIEGPEQLGSSVEARTSVERGSRGGGGGGGGGSATLDALYLQLMRDLQAAQPSRGSLSRASSSRFPAAAAASEAGPGPSSAAAAAAAMQRRPSSAGSGRNGNVPGPSGRSGVPGAAALAAERAELLTVQHPPQRGQPGQQRERHPDAVILWIERQQLEQQHRRPRPRRHAVPLVTVEAPDPPAL